jgi:regulator of sigma E protease
VDLVYFAVFVSVLIFVHELGHFVWAKIFGVKVLTFSIGFGPRIVRIRGRETEYCIGLLPLGGFVKMLEENRQEPVWPEDKHRTFDAQPLYKRVIIVLAGPAMNLIFPVLLYLGVFASQTDFAPPTVGVVLPNHAAHNRLRPGDRILEIDGVRVTTFAEVQRAVHRSPGKELHLKVFRNNEVVDVSVTPDQRTEESVLGMIEKIGIIGVGPNRPAAVIGIGNPASPAYRAGLRTLDLVTEVRGTPVANFAELEKLLADNRGETVPVTYLRPKRVPDSLEPLAAAYVYESGLAALTPEAHGDSLVERTGIELAELYLADVVPDSPEHRAGMREGDRLEVIDHLPITSWSMYEQKMAELPLSTHTVEWTRNGEKMNGMIRLAVEVVADAQGARAAKAQVGARNWAPRVPEKSVGRPSLFRYALPSALDETWDVIRFIVVGIGKIAKGELSLSTIGGPITVYDVVVQQRQKGTSYLLWAMAVISINLGLINLLPIPVLDGGHLLFFCAEALSRRPVPLRVREVMSLIGLIALVVFMGIAVKNDIERRWDVIHAQVEELFG